jgi:aminoglycoside phosphotransferase (APT) family kinase protein
MLELTPENTIDYLRSQGRLGPGPAHVELLGGGVSNVVLRVTTPEQRFVLKQSRPQLRTRDAWFSDLNRVYREQEVMEALLPLLPAGTVPAVLFADRENYVFAMSHAPAESRVWKEALLAGEIDASVGERAGVVLGRMHEGSAGNPRFAERFGERTVFDQLRIDPFYRTVQKRRPELADEVGAVIEQMLATHEAICHGDYTPKNILTHAGGFTLVDYETAYYGDPAMDIGLFLCHLVLKAFHRPAQRQGYLDLTRAFWRGYEAEVRFRPIAELEARGIGHCAVCLLARIDGTSPVDYLPEDAKRESVRSAARIILKERPRRWEDVLSLLAKQAALAPEAG